MGQEAVRQARVGRGVLEPHESHEHTDNISHGEASVGECYLDGRVAGKEMAIMKDVKDGFDQVSFLGDLDLHEAVRCSNAVWAGSTNDYAEVLAESLSMIPTQTIQEDMRRTKSSPGTHKRYPLRTENYVVCGDQGDVSVGIVVSFIDVSWHGG